jgi:plastocyanin
MNRVSRKSILPIVLLFVCGLLAVAMSHGAENQDKATKDTRIEIKDFSFQPKTITVPVSTKVVWVNKDEEPHTVASTDDVFKSKALDTDDQFSFTFDKKGTYEYFCSVHPRMTAKIVVVDAKSEQPMKMDKMK